MKVAMPSRARHSCSESNAAFVRIVELMGVVPDPSALTNRIIDRVDEEVTNGSVKKPL